MLKVETPTIVQISVGPTVVKHEKVSIQKTGSIVNGVSVKSAAGLEAV